MEVLSKRVQFSKGELDDYGMPSDYQAYLVRARKAGQGEAASREAGIARVYTLSSQAKPLNPDHVIGKQGVQGALESAIERLKKEHEGYSCQTFDMPI